MLLTHVRVDPNYFKPPHFPPLLECCQNGWLEALELLLSLPKVDVNFQLVRVACGVAVLWSLAVRHTLSMFKLFNVELLLGFGFILTDVTVYSKPPSGRRPDVDEAQVRQHEHRKGEKADHDVVVSRWSTTLCCDSVPSLEVKRWCFWLLSVVSMTSWTFS
jgi:hypothetical protein